MIQSTQFPWTLTINKVTCKEQEEKQVIYNGSPIGQISWHASSTLHRSSDANQPKTWLELSQTCSWFAFPEHCRAAGTLWWTQPTLSKRVSANTVFIENRRKIWKKLSKWRKANPALSQPSLITNWTLIGNYLKSSVAIAKTKERLHWSLGLKTSFTTCLQG